MNKQFSEGTCKVCNILKIREFMSHYNKLKQPVVINIVVRGVRMGVRVAGRGFVVMTLHLLRESKV